MRALTKTATGLGNVGIVDRSERDPEPGEALLRVLGAGICGTDLHIVQNEYPTTPPVTLGHEVCGEVLEVGLESDADWIGARAVAETFFSVCNRCRWCREGRPNLCPRRRSIGVDVDGAFAPHVVVPVRNLHRIPEWLDDHAATLVEPLACVVNALFDPAVVEAGDRVLVTGPGPIGLLAAQVARAGGGDVLVSGLESDRERLTVAHDELGFAVGAPAEEEYDVVIECSGSGGGAAAALAAARRGGRYVQIGLFGRTVDLALDLLVRKQVELSAGIASTPTSWLRAIALVQSGRVVLPPLVSRVVPLDEWEVAFTTLRSGLALKIVIDPRLEGAG